jgi:hypothetical protein
MKIIVSLLLIFTVLTDFTSASLHDDVSACETQISCTDVDFHASSESDDHNSDNSHDHCHLGHTHNVIISTSVVEALPSVYQITILYPELRVDQPINYLLDIIRPPIS